ncbi:MAG: TIGR02270 family protein [Nitrospira sp.]|nr:TIGR02270 family protein [Nitrospira sp.]
MKHIIDNIIQQHAEEAAFLWLLRTNAVRAPHYALKDLAKLDERVEAHLDGLRVAGESGWELCKTALGTEENGEVFAASVMTCESGIESRIQAVCDVVQQKPELSAGLISALGWIPFDQVASQAQRSLSAELPLQQMVGLAAYAAHRQDPGPALKDALSSTDLILKTRALKAAGELGKTSLIPAIKAELTAEDLACRYWAAWSGALLREPAAIPVLQRLAESGHFKREQACAMALRRMSIDQAQAWLRSLASSPEMLRLVVQAAGVTGDPANIPWLIQQMSDPVLARVAGESFTMITGIDLAHDDLDTNRPEDFEAGPTENPEDENIELDPDEDLPWPNPQLIEQWWVTHRLPFTNGTRYLLGKPITVDSLHEVLRTGRQRHRIAAAIELAMRQPGTPLFNTNAPGFRQQALLQAR